MSDLELLADTMEEWSTTSGDHHMLAATAIRQLIKLQALQSRESVACVGSLNEFDAIRLLRDGYALTDLLYTTPQPVVPEGFSLIANEILDRFPEINSSNYSHDDVDRLNAWGIELVLSAGKGGE
jgi:hypothetical protein